MRPLTPLTPAFEVVRAIAPEERAAPEKMCTLPTCAPARTTISPPAPLFPLPIPRITCPALPDVDEPVERDIEPPVPELLVPVAKVIAPDTPAVPELTVVKLSEPVDVAVPAPEANETDPPV
jgi:hypothetical protein